MSRAHLAPWGDELSSEESAAALAAAGVLGAAGGLSSQADTTSLAVSLEHRFMISPGEPVEWGNSTWTDWLSPSFLGPARPLADAWRASISALSTEHWPRLEVQATPRAFDVPWLVERLSLPSLQTRSVYVADSWLSQEAKWSWPMRLGILGEELSHHFRSSLIEDHWHGELFDLAEGSSELDQLDLLLVPGDAGSGLQEVLRAPAPVEANCVIVLGRRNEPWQAARPLLEALAAQTEASGVAVVPTAPGDRAKWLHELVRSLAHDAPINVALREASHNSHTPVPLFLANRALAQASRVSVQAKRMIEQVSAAVEPALVDVPERLARALAIDPGAAGSADVAARVRERLPSGATLPPQDQQRDDAEPPPVADPPGERLALQHQTRIDPYFGRGWGVLPPSVLLGERSDVTATSRCGHPRSLRCGTPTTGAWNDRRNIYGGVGSLSSRMSGDATANRLHSER
jgi:hypothetical protein